MRNGSTNRRSRGRNNNNRGKSGNNRAQVYDSNGPEVRIRGTAHQISEKYESLAKDSLSSGDMVLAESYLQHAEHYQRIITGLNEQQAIRQESNNQTQDKPGDNNGNARDESGGNNDLSLPSSILGEGVKVASEPVRALEDA